jgi:uncharacterized protein (DUF2141 family)
MKHAIILTALLTALLSSIDSHAGELKLELHGKDIKQQTLMIRIFDSETGFPSGKQYIRAIAADATSDSTTLLIRDLEPGKYAIAAFVDLNKNGKLDRSFIGIPIEPYGFSNDAHSLMGPPGFSQAAFELNEATNSQSIHLH